MTAGRLDLDELLRLRRKALRRMPTGERMIRFRWIAKDGTVWLLPAGLVSPNGMTSRSASSLWQTGALPRPEAFGFWLCVAARQDLWRSLQGVAGLMPVVSARPEAREGTVRLTLGAVLPERRASHAVEAVLEDMFQPRRINNWTAWAHRKARLGTPVA